MVGANAGDLKTSALGMDWGEEVPKRGGRGVGFEMGEPKQFEAGGEWVLGDPK